jgi:hypothetical protein
MPIEGGDRLGIARELREKPQAAGVKRKARKRPAKL